MLPELVYPCFGYLKIDAKIRDLRTNEVFEENGIVYPMNRNEAEASAFYAFQKHMDDYGYQVIDESYKAVYIQKTNDEEETLSFVSRRN